MIKEYFTSYTPVCDAESKSAGYFSDYHRVVSLSDAEELEKRARLAEAKLEALAKKIKEMEDIFIGIGI